MECLLYTENAAKNCAQTNRSQKLQMCSAVQKMDQAKITAKGWTAGRRGIVEVD